MPLYFLVIALCDKQQCFCSALNTKMFATSFDTKKKKYIYIYIFSGHGVMTGDRLLSLSEPWTNAILMMAMSALGDRQPSHMIGAMLRAQSGDQFSGLIFGPEISRFSWTMRWPADLQLWGLFCFGSAGRWPPSMFTIKTFIWWRYWLALCDEIFNHFPLFDETLHCTSHWALQ